MHSISKKKRHEHAQSSLWTLAKFEKCPKNVISSIFEPHRDHEIMRYSPISLWMRKIRLRDIVNVYLKHNYCIQFQRKKGINMRNRHFGNSAVTLFKKKSPEMGTKRLEMVWNVEKTYRENENFFEKTLKIFAQNVRMTSSHQRARSENFINQRWNVMKLPFFSGSCRKRMFWFQK